ncbi:hypothetical protein PAESOLCIP111_03283 [Paenibacillus solanacearum]|uniref:Uncharacterized protein n=1 Tax=Paenibacillus solanacearum TaxID=2048548 RepID=A0A916K5T0_9BACL|nr:hypothetical protein [Paenibacillus solanacearum]CAG7631285.1 hypothetical protein PAESOLCIP111_03283 [Paenibacillus solanacearum]
MTLQEGRTPLVCAQHLSNELYLDLCFKYEALNLTGVMKPKQGDGFEKGQSAVCILAGHGMKHHLDITIKRVSAEPLVVQDSEAAVMEAIRKLEG